LGVVIDGTGAQRLEATSLGDLAYAAVRERLENGHLEMGSRVNEVHLAAELGISRGTLRVACRRLVQDGLLVETPNRGISVVAFDAAEIVELTNIRLSLEALAVRLVRARGLDRDALARRLDDLDTACTSGEAAAIMRAELAFHVEIFAQAASRPLMELYRNVRARERVATVAFDRDPIGLRSSIDRHRPLFDALCDGTTADAVGVVEAHVRAHARSLAERGIVDLDALVPPLFDD